MTFIYERAAWPHLEVRFERVAEHLADVRFVQGRLLGRMERLGFALRAEATLQNLTEEVLKSSDIEGETLDRDQVRSSVARRLGMDIGALVPADRNVEGVVEMMLDATQNHAEPLTKARLFAWHAALFPTGRSGMVAITAGGWRKDKAGPMRVVSGPIGREKIHYEAPAAARADTEMRAFLKWFNAPAAGDPVIKAALAHLWFVTIHPFDDGNGRIARALTDLLLARSEKTAQRFYSMSAQIRVERGEYYKLLENTQKGDVDVTPWIGWFLACLGRAIEGAETALGSVLTKAAFWERCRTESFNERQRTLLNAVLDGFDGNLTTSKWAKIAKCSPDTALRDIEDLVARKLLVKNAAGGRSTSYSLDASSISNDGRLC